MVGSIGLSYSNLAATVAPYDFRGRPTPDELADIPMAAGTVSARDRAAEMCSGMPRPDAEQIRQVIRFLDRLDQLKTS